MARSRFMALLAEEHAGEGQVHVACARHELSDMRKRVAAVSQHGLYPLAGCVTRFLCNMSNCDAFYA